MPNTLLSTWHIQIYLTLTTIPWEKKHYCTYFMCEKTGPATESLNKLSDVQQSSGRARLETENVFPAFRQLAIIYALQASLGAQMVKRLPAMRNTQVRSLGREDPLEKEMAIHSSTLGWRILWTEERGRLQSMGLQRVGHDWATSLSLSPSYRAFKLPFQGCDTQSNVL